MKLHVLALILFTMTLANFAFAKGVWGNTPEASDLVTLKELDQKAQRIWEDLVRNTGSKQQALRAVYLVNSKPDPRLKELHEEVSQFVDSSTFDHDAIQETRVRISGMLRFVLANIAIHYAKPLVGKVSNQNHPLLSLVSPTMKSKYQQAALMMCATLDQEPNTVALCIDDYGMRNYLLARKAGRAAVLSTLSNALTEREVYQYAEREYTRLQEQLQSDYLASGRKASLDPQKLLPPYQTYLEKISGDEIQKTCQTNLNKKASDLLFEIYDTWNFHGVIYDMTRNDFYGRLSRCIRSSTGEELSFEVSLVGTSFENTHLIGIADAYFPKDDIK